MASLILRNRSGRAGWLLALAAGAAGGAALLALDHARGVRAAERRKSESAVMPPEADLPRATLVDTLAFHLDLTLPTLARGLILRRPWVMRIADRLDLDRRAIRRMTRLRERYGPGPVLLRMPVRNEALLLEPPQVERVLKASPHPFAVASSEKRAALRHFQPQGALASDAAERPRRRAINDEALDSRSPMHAVAGEFLPWLREETSRMAATAKARGTLRWEDFIVDWFAIVRRLLLGNGARNDHALTDMLARLRADANWAFLPTRGQLREAFFRRLRTHLERAERGSIAGFMAHHAIPAEESAKQVPQWLFAFDAAAIATVRALALLGSHPEHAQRALRESREALSDGNGELRFLRACVLESVRLWPTTPLVLRQSDVSTWWTTGRLPERSGVLIYLPFFHRDPKLSFADRFTPGLWLDEVGHEGAALVPFSDGPAFCAGRELTLLLTSEVLAALIAGGLPQITGGTPPDARRPLPATLDGYGLTFGWPAST